MPNFDEADRHATRLEGMRVALEMTDGVVCKRRDISLVFGNAVRPANPAWCVNGSIHIEINAIPDIMSVKGMTTLIGLNYHEVAHTIYSPLNHTQFSPTGGRRPSFQCAYEILEESRVETLMVGRYSAVRGFFLLPVLTFLQETGAKNDSELFLLTHGRRYIPADIRRAFRDYFEKQYGAHAVDQFAAVIDRYRFIALTSSDKFEEAADLINSFAKLMEKYRVSPPDVSHTGSSGRSNITSVRGHESSAEQQYADQGRDAQKAEQQEAQDARSGAGEQPGQERGEPAELPDPQDGGGKADADSGEDGGRGGQDQPKEAGRPTASGGRSERSDGAQGRSDPKDDPAGGVGSQDDPRARRPTPSHSQLENDIEKQIAELLKDEKVLQKVHSLRSAMNDHVAQNSTLEDDPARTSRAPVTADMVRRSDELYHRLQELWSQIESGWNFGVSEGSRLDMNRIFSAQTDEELENVYIDWEPGRQESSGVACVILADESGSMSSYSSVLEGTRGKKRYQIASESVWGVRYALDRVEAKTTVLTFQTGCQTLYDRDEDTDPGHYRVFQSGGGTNPYAAVREARRILSVSEAPYKVLLVFSDGSWGGMNHQEIADSLSSMGDVVKVCALIRGSDRYSFAHQKFFDIVEETRGDILDIMARAVVHLMERIVQ